MTTGPTAAELAAARGRRVPDLVGPGLRILLVGINPSLYSAWAGRHFARPGNRLWRTLHESGLTEELLRPDQPDRLLAAGIGVTNLVGPATARADELTPGQLRAGVSGLRRLVRRHRPGHVAVLGIDAFRTAFAAPTARVGRQPEPFAGAALWLLPNPSGLNASYQQPALTAAYRALALAAGATGTTTAPRPRSRRRG